MKIFRRSNNKNLKKAATSTVQVRTVTPAPVSPASTSNWIFTEVRNDGSAQIESVGKQEKLHGSIKQGINTFKSNPTKYAVMLFQSDMLDEELWPESDQHYTLIHREGTKGYKPMNMSSNGWQMVLLQRFQPLLSIPKDELPAKFRDNYTDSVLARWKGKKLPKPYLPGRGMGVVDATNIKIIGDVDPSDIEQGAVGNCWLLSGISSLAEFDGAVKKLFRKTKNLDGMPSSDGPNQYIITLWDLPTWKEVDIVIDERLCAHPNAKGQLLSSKPSIDGELWVCYLEKAIAAHCGGWDKITGGQCTHAWALLTGCKEQYTIKKNKKSRKYGCYARYNVKTKKWANHTNSPHDSDPSVWPVPWPEVGGGGEGDISQEELFMRLCAWDDVNFIMGAGRGTAQKAADGMVDNHGYSVIECKNDVAGTPIDLIKVRNPWGHGEIEDGEFDDDGPGWDRYPQIKAALNPVRCDDGIFWVTKDEFFELYDTFYLSASNMTEFLED